MIEARVVSRVAGLNRVVRLKQAIFLVNVLLTVSGK